MSKEKIMEEFDKMMIMTSRIPDSERVFGFDIKSNQPLKNWLSQVLDQVRLETIREVEEMLPEVKNSGVDDGDYSDQANFTRIGIAYMNNVIKEIKFSLNKLK